MRNWFNVATSDEAIEIDIYGPIGKSWWDDDSVGAKDILDALKGNALKPVTIHVNSEGGSVFDGFAIYSQLQQHQGKVTVYVDGLAASAASYIIAAADEVRMSDVAWLMIHEASGLSWGNKRELRKEADVLENIDHTIASIYATRSADHDDVYFLNLMEEETWMDATTARAHGLADYVEESLPMVARLDFHNEALLEHAPQGARDLIASMMADEAPSDTCEKVDEAAIDEQEQIDDESQEASFVAINGKVYRKENK